MKTPTIKETSSEPEVKMTKEPMMTIKIDKDMTDGGIRINGKLYVGNQTLPQGQAEDLLRIQEEYYETKKKLLDKNISVRMKSDFQKEALFLADPVQNSRKSNYTRDYGLLPIKEWTYCTKEFQTHLLQLRMDLYGY
jgi:hypothetical protein